MKRLLSLVPAGWLSRWADERLREANRKLALQAAEADERCRTAEERESAAWRECSLARAEIWQLRMDLDRKLEDM